MSEKCTDTPIYNELFKSVRHQLDRQALREILLAAHGKKISRLSLPEGQIPEIVTELERAGLWVDLHHQKQILNQDQGKGGWASGYGLEVPVESPLPGYVLLYTGTDPAKVLAAKKAEYAHQHRTFGTFLGYPPCCIGFYETHLAQAECEQGDFILPLLEVSLTEKSGKPDIFPAWTNVAAQYFGYGLISFYPCSFFCEQAAAAAQEAWKLMAIYDAELAAAFLAASRMPILYTEYEGIYAFTGAKLKGDVLHYDNTRLECLLNGVIASVLAQGDAIAIRSHRSVDVLCGNSLVARLESPSLGLLIFD